MYNFRAGDLLCCTDMLLMKFNNMHTVAFVPLMQALGCQYRGLAMCAADQPERPGKW